MATNNRSLQAHDEHREQPDLIRRAQQPLAWLSVAVGGLVLAGVGIAIDAYRHDHGAAAAELISRSNPGLLVALAGLLVAALGVLMGSTLLAFDGAQPIDSLARRGAAVVVAWVAVAAAGAAGVTYATTSGLTVGHAGHSATAESVARPTPAPTRTATPPTEVPGVAERVTLGGTLTLDGRPLDAQFLGAEVIRDGLLAACQTDIPGVSGGRYEIPVAADSEQRGCGAPGAQIVLWTNLNDRYVYTTATMPWPGNGANATFDAAFSTATPDGARPPGTGFKGHVVLEDGTRLGAGTIIEAYVGETRCGVASVRSGEGAWFTLLVAGPQVPGCEKDGSIRFVVNGGGFQGSVPNDLKGSRIPIELTAD